MPVRLPVQEAAGLYFDALEHHKFGDLALGHDGHAGHDHSLHGATQRGGGGGQQAGRRKDGVMAVPAGKPQACHGEGAGGFMPGGKGKKCPPTLSLDDDRATATATWPVATQPLLLQWYRTAVPSAHLGEDGGAEGVGQMLAQSRQGIQASHL